MIDVLCIGYAAYDLYFYTDLYPQENKKYIIECFRESGGGPAANAAYLLSRWGIHTAFAGLVGDDMYGQMIIKEFKQAGTDIRLIEVKQDYSTPLSAIIVNHKKGSRTVLNRRQDKTEISPDKDILQTMNPRVILVDGHQLRASLTALKYFPDAICILDAGSLRKATTVLLRKVDYALCSEDFALAFSRRVHLDTADMQNQCLKALFKENNKNIAVTRGQKGLIYLEKGNVKSMAAYPVRAIDTTAAGDIFHGAFAYCMLKNMNFYSALKFSSIAAALSATAYGGRSSIPSLKRVTEIYEKL